MQIIFSLFRRLLVFCSESCGYFIPKIVVRLFVNLWVSLVCITDY